MFCPKCGILLADESCNCSNCDWSLKAQESGGAFNVGDCETAFEQPEDKAQDTQIGAATTYTQNIIGASPQISFDKKKLLVLIIAILALSVGIGVLIYHNSDTYKIKKSSELIIMGNYFEAANKIQDVYTPQAKAIKDFINIEIAKDSFVDSVVDETSNTSETYSEFYNKLNEFSSSEEYHYLTEELSNHYNCYRYAFDCVLNYTSYEDSDIPQALYNVQEVMMNEVSRNKTSKNNGNFTLSELQERVNRSKSALEKLKAANLTDIKITDVNITTYCNMRKSVDDVGYRVCLSQYLCDILETLIINCESEIESSQELIDDCLEKWDMDDTLYTINPDPNYSSFVGDDLESIKSSDDILTNRTTIVNLLQRDMLYYLVTGSMVPIS